MTRNLRTAPILLLLIVSLRAASPAFPSIPRDCSGGNQYGLVNVNVCSFNCDASCCGLLGGSNTLCQTAISNIVNNVTIGSLLSLCGSAGNGGGPVCSTDAFDSGAACVGNIQQLENLAAVCNLALGGTAGGLATCMEANNITANQLVACCSSNGSGGVTCTGDDFCSNTANGYTNAYANCCTIACGVSSS